MSRPRIRRLATAALAAGLLAASPALAVTPEEILSDKALERRARAISAELRCLVCQNQSIDDSDAPLARDLRVLVRDRLQAGDSDGAVRAYVVSRYGDFVLLRPPLRAGTLLLWLGPLVIVAAGAAGLLLVRTRRRPAATAPLTSDEDRRIRAILDSDRA